MEASEIPLRKERKEMKKICISIVVILFLFVGNASAGIVGHFGESGVPGTVQASDMYGSSELILHIGEVDGNENFDPASFEFDVQGFDINAVHQFRFYWESDSFSGDNAALNSGSIFWNGSLRDFFDRTYTVTGLEISATPIPIPGDLGIENGNGHIFYTSFTDIGLTNIQEGPVNMTFAQISTVPVPRAILFLGSGLLGIAGLSRRKKMKLGQQNQL